MKITIRIPTTQFAYIEAEGEEKDLPKMIELHNKYCAQKIVEQQETFNVNEALDKLTIIKKPRQANPYKGISEQGPGFNLPN